jgi:RNA polymerase sigma-70 factor, ECF subfamily
LSASGWWRSAYVGAASDAPRERISVDKNPPSRELAAGATMSTTVTILASASRLDAASCAHAFEAELDFVMRVLRRQGIRPADAEDLAQDVFLVMCRRWSDYQQDRPLRPWLAGIAVHLAIKHRERRRREVALSDEEAADAAPPPDDRLATKRAHTLVLAAMERLPERHRTALAMHDLEGIAVKDLASFWRVPLFTAYTRIRVARRAFSDAIAELQAPTGRQPSRRAAMSALAMHAREGGDGALDGNARARIQARVRALIALPRASWPKPEADIRPPGRAPAWPPLAIGGAVGVGLAVVLFASGSARWSARPAARAPAVSRLTAPAVRRGVPPFVRPAAVPQPAEAPVPDAPVPSDGVRQAASGLVGQWRLDDGRGSARAADSSGRGRDCVLRGFDLETAWIGGRQKGALRFRRGARVECSLPEEEHTPASELTVAAWIRPDRLVGHQAIAARAREGAPGELFFFGFREGDLLVSSRTWLAHVTRPFPASPRTWVHVAFTRAADGTIKLYADGVALGRARSRQTDAVRASGPLRVGAGLDRPEGPRPGRNEQQFSGALDELSLYDRALSDEEVAALRAGDAPETAATAAAH